MEGRWYRQCTAAHGFGTVCCSLFPDNPCSRWGLAHVDHKIPTQAASRWQGQLQSPLDADSGAVLADQMSTAWLSTAWYCAPQEQRMGRNQESVAAPSPAVALIPLSSQAGVKLWDCSVAKNVWLGTNYSYLVLVWWCLSTSSFCCSMCLSSHGSFCFHFFLSMEVSFFPISLMKILSLRPSEMWSFLCSFPIA